VFECACGQVARSAFEFERHPKGRFCEKDPVRAELEARPVEEEGRSGNITRYPKINRNEEWKS